MKILLVMSPMFRHDTHYLSSQDTEVPISLLYLGAVLEKAGHSVKLLDGQILPDVELEKQIKESLLGENYQTVGFSATSPATSNTKKLSALVKKIRPDITTIIGGAHPTVVGPEILREMPHIDIAVIGEGEKTILELTEFLEGKRTLETIDGIAFRKNEEIIQTKRRTLIEDLDTLPFPAYHLVDIPKYTPPPGLFFKKPTISIGTARGCPYHCNYCADTVIWQGRCRMHSAEYVVDEMEHLVKERGVKEIRFFDDTFTLDRERTIKICEELSKRKLNVIWRCASRADKVDLELLKLMKKNGCWSISFGIESGSEEILRKMNRTITLEQVKKAVKWSQQAGMETKGFFMLNYPGDTIETTEKTIAFSRELDLDFVGFNLTVPIKGTQAREEILRNYKIEPKYWDNWDTPFGNQIYFYQDDLPVEYLKSAYWKAIGGFHLRPKIILRSLKKIRSFTILKSYIAGFLRLFKIKVLD